MQISERKENVLNFLEKKMSEGNEQEAEKLLILMEGIKAGIDLGKEEKKAAG